MTEYVLIQVLHPQYTTDEVLAEWLERLEIRSDPLYDQLRWSVPGSTALPQAPDIALAFLPNGQVKVIITDRVSRVISFLNAQTDDERIV